MRSPMERTDWALLAAYLLAAALGTWNDCLLIHDGAVFITAGWLGNAWELYYDQNTPRAFSVLLTFGPAWAARWAFDLSSGAYVVLAHILYFAAPLVLWLAVRAVEPQRLFSRLYLAVTLALIYFLAEVVVGVGLWMLWMAMVVDANRPPRQVALASLVLGAAMAFSHPVTALMSVVYLIVGGALALFRPFPRRALVATAVMIIWLLAAYFAASKWLPATNPTILAAVAVIRHDYISPSWMIATLVLFPMLLGLWLLLLAPGTISARLRWRFSPVAVLIIAALGLWFAAAGVGLLTWLHARHTAAYVLAVATALALVDPSVWLVEARRPLMLYAAVTVVAVVSYNADLFLFGRFVDRFPGQGLVDVEAPRPVPWPPQASGPPGARIYFKWAAGSDYLRDVLIPTYDWYRVTLAFYSYFRSDRQRVLYHPLGRRGDWIPFQCGPVGRALAQPHDAADRMFLTFLNEDYCVL